MRKNGTWRTELATKSKPPTSWSSQVAVSKSTKKETDHKATLTATICTGQRKNLTSLRMGEAYRNRYDQPDEDSCAYCYGRLPIVLVFEEARVLKSPEC